MTLVLLFAIVRHLLQSTLFVLVAAGLTILVRKNQARLRYGIWLVASLKFLVPFSLLMAFGNQFSWRTVAVADRPSLTVFTGPASAAAPARQTPPPPIESVPARTISLAIVLLSIWGGGAVTVAAIWAIRSHRVAQCVRRASPVDVGRELEALRRIEGRAGIQKPIEMRLSGGSLEPGVFGSLRPVLILPAGIGCHLSKPQLESVIAHELSHVRRYDNLTASLHMIVGVLFWFYPLVWWLGSRLVDERERACDEDVLKLIREPQEYAEGILRVCELYLKSPVLSVAGVTGSNLKKRIEDIVTPRVVRALSFKKALLFSSVGLLSLAVPIGIGVSSPAMYAQQSKASKPLAFEVVSVRPNNSGDSLDYSRYLSGGRYSARLSLRNLVGVAYRSEIEPGGLSGGPDWVASARFDIEAKAPAGVVAPGQLEKKDTDKLELMLRALLADRFKLRLRAENRKGVVYSLVVAKSGSKLLPPRTEMNCKTPDGWTGLRTEDISPECHVFPRFGPRGTIGQSVDAGDIARSLAVLLSAPVENKTGLKGLHDLSLHWTPGPQDRRPREDGVEVDPTGSDLFTALQEQLGLKLESRKGPVKHLIIEGAESPSEN